MHKAFLTAFAAAILFTVAVPTSRAEASAAAAPSRATASSLVREAAIICGGNGCNPVHTKADKRRKFQPLGYTKPVKQSALSSHAATA
jgi:hypothetical protein